MSTPDQSKNAAPEIIERRILVWLTAAGFNGRFQLPEKHFNELMTWLSDRSCGPEKQPNDKSNSKTP